MVEKKMVVVLLFIDKRKEKTELRGNCWFWSGILNQ